MILNIDSELEAVLKEIAERQGVPPEVVALNALRDRLLIANAPSKPEDEWESLLSDVPEECGVSLSDSALTSEGIYE